jgi:CheY-like chemotaxis protein/HPt (histidine-containing phosphotransfer) domain-containing protein
MTAIRILHVDDEPDIREVVELSLSLNPDFEIRSCGSGEEAVAIASEWLPFIILLDVMMPGMDGPTTLTHLRNNPRTADIPVLFMTARAQAREVERFILLGAQGVVSKPFDPMTLAFQVRSHLQAARIETMRGVFKRRARSDAAQLESCRSSLAKDGNAEALRRVRTIAHGLAGAAGLFGFERISNDATALEEVVLAKGSANEVARAIDHLVAGVKNEWDAPPAAVA